MLESEKQAVIDHEHLRMLRIGYLIAGGVNALWSFFPLIYVAMGAFMIFAAPATADDEAQSVGLFVMAIGLALTVLFIVAAVLKFLTARAIGRRTSRTLCLVTAGLTCFGIPYGTALGVVTFMVLSRPSVVELFASTHPGSTGRVHGI